MENGEKELTLEEKAKMEKPKIAKPFPYSMKLEPGKEYFWCACGLSKKQPLCDGSHVGTKFKPLAFKSKTSHALLCACKRNDKTAGPYCDGAHSTKDLDW